MAESLLSAGTSMIGEPGMMALSGMAGGKLAGFAAGDSSSGNGMGGLDAMNNILNTALNNAINQATEYTNQANQQLNIYNANAQRQLKEYLGKATNEIKDQSMQGFNMSQALNAPYANAGYSAIDALQDSMGLKRTQAGSQALSQALLQDTMVQQQLKDMGPRITPVAPQSLEYYKSQISPGQIEDYIRANMQENANLGLYGGAQGNQGAVINIGGQQFAELNPQLLLNHAYGAAQDYLSNQALSNAQAQFTQQQKAYGDYTAKANQMLTNYSPEQQALAAAYKRGLFS